MKRIVKMWNSVSLIAKIIVGIVIGAILGILVPGATGERGGSREDLPLEEAAQQVHRLALRPCAHPLWGKRSY